MSEHTLSQRAQQVLKIVVERYIQEGNPIGSTTLAREYSLGFSPATIRHILSDLEEAGYLSSPHTSAGRVPTSSGYRLFVNHLLTVNTQQLNPVENIQELEHTLQSDLPMPELLKSASDVLSKLTQLVGVVVWPCRNQLKLRQVEFLPLSENRVLVILVLNNCDVENRIIHLDRYYSPTELQQAANYLNSHYSGVDLAIIRQQLQAAIVKDRESMTSLLQTAMAVTDKAFSKAEQKGCVIVGENNLIHHTTDIESLRTLFEMLTQKQDILSILEQALAAEGIQIFIGKESGHDALGEYSVVSTTYAVEGQVIGSLGVIGPTRMRYDRVITAVDITAKLLSNALHQVQSR